MADVSKDAYRGILIPDPRIKNANINLTDSTFNQAGPQPGVAVDTSPNKSDLVINSGGISAANDKLRIKTLNGGFPGKIDSSASFVWYDENSYAQLLIEDLRFDAVAAGPDGENVTIAYTTGATAGAEVVTVTANAISIQIDDGFSTNTQIKTAFDLVAAAVALASCNDIGPSSSSIYNGGAAAATALSNQYRGYNSPVALTGWEWLEFDLDGTSTTNIDYKDPEVLTLDNDIVICVYQGDDGATPYAQNLKIQTFDPDTSVWTERSTIVTGIETTAFTTLGAALTKTSSGRVLLYHWGAEVNSKQNIVMYYSDDDGVTFTLGSTAVLNNDINTASFSAVGRIRAAYNKGNICLIASAAIGAAQGVIQWASSDDGNTFTDVDVGGTTTVVQINEFDLIALDTAGFLVVYINGSNIIKSKRLENAYDRFDNVTAVSINSSLTSNTIAIYKYENNKIGLLARSSTTLKRGVYTWNTIDNGDTWYYANVDDDLHTFEFDESTTVFSELMAATFCRGTLILPFKYNDNAEVLDTNSLAVAYLGGSSTVTLPLQSVNQGIKTQAAWEMTYLGLTLPDTLGWTATTTAGTVTFSDYGLKITTAAANQTYRSRTFGTTATDGLLMWVNLKVEDDDTGVPTAVYFQGLLDEGGGGDTWGVRCSLSETGFIISDVAASSVEYANVSVVTTSGVEVIIALNTETGSVDGQFTYWYRANGTTVNKEWKMGQSSLTMQRYASNGSINNRVEFGHIGSTAVSHWKHILTSRLSFTESTIDFGQTNPDDLIARFFSNTSTPVNGTSISTLDGPTYREDSWSIDTKYDYGIENIDINIQPSPQTVWRSTGETSEDIIWDLNDQGAVTKYGNDTIAIALIGSNIKKYTLSGKDVGGSWNVIGAIDTRLLFTGAYSSRAADAITLAPAAGNRKGDWLDYNELAGGTVNIDYADVAQIKSRLISSNTEGTFTDDTAKTPVIFFDGLDGTEQASGNATALVPRQNMSIYKGVADYTAFKVNIDTNTGGTVIGAHELGGLIIGQVMYFGKQYSHGREISLETNTELTTRRDGSRYSKVLGPSRRTVSFSWDEGIDTTQINDATAAPDYSLPYTGATPISTPGGTPSQVMGLLDYTNGSHIPVVYIPYIEKTSSSKVYRFKREFIYGRIVSSANIAAVVGDENDSEVLRISSIEIEEEV